MTWPPERPAGLQKPAGTGGGVAKFGRGWKHHHCDDGGAGALVSAFVRLVARSWVPERWALAL